jgi:two-component system, NarL family, sensor histidine kinase DesK
MLDLDAAARSPGVLAAGVQPIGDGRVLGDNCAVIESSDRLRARGDGREATDVDTSRFIPAAAAVAIGLNIMLPAIELARTAILPEFGNALLALFATAVVVPLHIRHVIYGLRGERAPMAAWTLTGLAIVSVGAALVVGVGWLLNLALLAVSALIIVRGPLAIVLAGAVVVLAGALAGNSALLPWPYIALSVAWRTVTLFVPVWLVATIWQLEAARRELRDRAVVRERLRIQAELRRGLGGTLDEIVASGARAAALVNGDTTAATVELTRLVGGSRQALADARRLVAGYRAASVRAELDAAMTLLEAAGVESQLSIAEGISLDGVDERSRAAVRLAVMRALRDESPVHCLIEVQQGEGGKLRVLISAHDENARRLRANEQ